MEVQQQQLIIPKEIQSRFYILYVCIKNGLPKELLKILHRTIGDIRGQIKMHNDPVHWLNFFFSQNEDFILYYAYKNQVILTYLNDIMLCYIDDDNKVYKIITYRRMFDNPRHLQECVIVWKNGQYIMRKYNGHLKNTVVEIYYFEITIK